MKLNQQVTVKCTQCKGDKAISLCFAGCFIVLADDGNKLAESHDIAVAQGCITG